MTYGVLITYLENNENVSLLLDSVEDTQITADSTLTTHPTVFGTPMADHMYKNPITLSLRGTFALHGKQGLVFKNGHGSLERVEKIFEHIKDAGIECTIVKIRIEGSNNVPQFTVRDFMVLTNISWTEKIDTLDYSFSFTEALKAEIKPAEAIQDDKFLPDINLPEPSSAFGTLIKWEDVDAQVLQALFTNDLMSKDFYQKILSFNKAAFIAIVGIAAAGAIAALLVSLGILSAIPGGIIVAAVLAVAAVAVVNVVAMFKFFIKNSLTYRIAAFTVYKIESKMNAEVKRFTGFYDNMHKRIQSLDSAIHCYTITENKPQELLISVGGDYLVFTFEKNNINSGNTYKLTVSDTSGAVLQTTSTTSALKGFTDGTFDNKLCEKNEWLIYLLSAAETDKDKADLTKYIICCSAINPWEFSKALQTVIVEALRK